MRQEDLREAVGGLVEELDRISAGTNDPDVYVTARNAAEELERLERWILVRRAEERRNALLKAVEGLSYQQVLDLLKEARNGVTEK